MCLYLRRLLQADVIILWIFIQSDNLILLLELCSPFSDRHIHAFPRSARKDSLPCHRECYQQTASCSAPSGSASASEKKFTPCLSAFSKAACIWSLSEFYRLSRPLDNCNASTCSPAPCQISRECIGPEFQLLLPI